MIPTTDTVATQTLEAHQLTRLYGATHLAQTVCSCGQRGTEAWGLLHLVEMGVEAGVAAMAELRERETARAEPTPLEKAHRDLVGYIDGMRQSGRAPDWNHWRDVLATLVVNAADVGRTAPNADELAADLWLELEQAEDLHSIPADAQGTDTSGRPMVHCSTRSRHAWHTYRMQTPTDLVGESNWVEVTCNGEPGGHGQDKLPDQSHQLPHLNCDRGQLHFAHAWEPVTSGAPRVAWCTGD